MIEPMHRFCLGLLATMTAASAVGVTALPSVALAQAPRARAAPLLHERLPMSAAPRRKDGVVRDEAGEIDAIETAGGRIDKPERPGKGAPQAPLYEAPRHDKARVRTDRKTEAEGTLHYRAVFNPTVAPFKRDLSFDRVAPTGELEQSGAGLRAIRPSDRAQRSGDELFWGHVTVELRAGKRTPIPSVAPTAALVHAQSTPRRALTFYRDAAGNFSVSAKRGGTVSLRYLLAAPSAYFAAPIGAGPVTDDPVTPRLEAVLQRRMRQLWPALGLSPTAPRKEQVEKLVQHFRSFEPGQLDVRPGADLLVELIVARRGVCRHRSHAFVALAHSLGIPAHYVINAAHAFVEVWVPDLRGKGHWQRVDLGGGADTLRLHGADRKHLHDPLFRDPLPRPPAYETGVTGVVADGRLNDTSWAGAGKVVGANGLVGRGGGTNANQAAAVATDDGQRHATQAAAGSEESENPGDSQRWLRQRAIERATIARNVAAPAQVPGKAGLPPSSKRQPTVLKLSNAAPVAYVGETLLLKGKLSRADGRALAKMPIEVWLVHPRQPSQGQRLGTALTGADGSFTARVALPMSLRLGEHDVVVHFPGRGKLAPAYSRE